MPESKDRPPENTDNAKNAKNTESTDDADETALPDELAGDSAESDDPRGSGPSSESVESADSVDSVDSAPATSPPAPPRQAGAKKPTVKPPAARAAEARAVAEAERRRRAQKADATNPEWWVPTFVTLLLVGLVWVVTFYVTAGQYPVRAFDYWNLAIGFGLLIAGFGMTMRWR